MNKVEKAYDLLKAVKNPDFRVLELMAQSLYRLERFTEAFEQYKNLIKNFEDDYEDDYEDERESNLAGVVAKICLTAPDSLDNVPDLGEQTYELCFNKACIEIGRRNYTKAFKLLNLAADKCLAMLKEEGADDDEIETEMSTIKNQVIYVYLLTGRNQDASERMSSGIQRSKALADVLSFDEVISNVDVDALEASSWSLGAKYVKKVVNKVEQSPAARLKDKDGKPIEDEKPKKQRKRKRILPKNYDPNVVPDPERWIPKWQRATTKNKRERKRREAVGKGTQGAVGGDAESYTKPNQAKDSPRARDGPRQQRNRRCGGRRK